MPKKQWFFQYFQRGTTFDFVQKLPFFQAHVIMKISFCADFACASIWALLVVPSCVWEKLLWMFPRRRLSGLCISLQRECMRFSNRREVVSPQDGTTRRAHMLAHAKSAQNEIFIITCVWKNGNFWTKSKGVPLWKYWKNHCFF